MTPIAATTTRKPRAPLVSLLLLNAVIMGLTITLDGDLGFLAAAVWLECGVIALWAIPKCVYVAWQVAPERRLASVLVAGWLSAVAFAVLMLATFFMNEGSQILISERVAGSRYYGLVHGAPFDQAPWQSWLLLLSMLVSHGVSFRVNFLSGQAWREMDPVKPWKRAFARMIWLILALLVGVLLAGFAAEVVKRVWGVSPETGARIVLASLCLLVRAVADVWSHLQEHGQRWLWRWRYVFR